VARRERTGETSKSCGSSQLNHIKGGWETDYWGQERIIPPPSKGLATQGKLSVNRRQSCKKDVEEEEGEDQHLRERAAGSPNGRETIKEGEKRKKKKKKKKKSGKPETVALAAR